MTLASTIKIVVLAAYAREVAAGRLDPHAELPIREWERFYLPGTDGGAHAAALAALGIPTDQDGFASNPEAAVSWDRIAQAMIRSSDNAATDLLLIRARRSARSAPRSWRRGCRGTRSRSRCSGCSSPGRTMIRAR